MRCPALEPRPGAAAGSVVQVWPVRDGLALDANQMREVDRLKVGELRR